MASLGKLMAFLGPCLLLVLIYLVWFVRYPTWQLFSFIESIFLMLIASYSAILVFSMVFLKKDMKISLSQNFEGDGYTPPAIGMGFALLFQILWFSVYLLIGGKLEFSSFPNLEEYGGYMFYSIPSAFGLYVGFAVFGAFAEEVAFRSYIQSRIVSKYSIAVGILASSIFFSLQHIHVFNLGWIAEFFQSQFVYVFCFGIFVGYLFTKSNGDLWSVFAFHGLMNVFNISLPIRAASDFLAFNHVATVVAFIFMILILKYMLREGINNEKQ